MKKLKLYFDNFSAWIDRNFGYYLTNPVNRWRWEKRQEERNTKK